MAEPFKNLIGTAQVDWLASQLSAAWSAFPADAFRKRAKAGLSSLELKARARHVADALEATLPQKKALAVLIKLLQADQGEGGGFRYLALSEFLERHGPDEVEQALRELRTDPALHE